MAKTKKIPPGKTAERKKVLGKGLSSLLGEAAGSLHEFAEPVRASVYAGGGDTSASPPQSQSATGEVMAEIHRIHPGPWQPRRNFDNAGLAELAASIKSRGVVQPLLVRPKPGAEGEYELIAGERRWRAAQQAGLHALPVFVRALDDTRAAELALIENIQRRDLNALEEAMGYAKLMDEFGHTQQKLGEIVGKSRSHVANALRLLTLPLDVQDMLAAGEITSGQVRPLIGRDNASALAAKIIAGNMSARQVEAMMAREEKETPSKSGGRPRDANLAALEKTLAKSLGVAVRLRYNEKSGHGRITIAPRTLEQFEAIMARLK